MTLCLLVAVVAADPSVTRVWLTPRSADVVSVSWTTPEAGPSEVDFGPTEELGRTLSVRGDRTRHRVGIPVEGPRTFYRVRSGAEVSAVRSFGTLRQDGPLRLAVVANWHMTVGRQDPPDLSALIADRPHLLLTAGDNIGSFWGDCGPTDRGCFLPYDALFDAYPDLFATTLVLPASGNHDREVRGRGKTRPPAEDARYDSSAETFLRVFDTPGGNVFWRLDVPTHRVRVMAADLHHVSDFGTGWQSGRPFDADSPQLTAFERWTDRAPENAIALFNEKASTVRGLARKRWGDVLSRVPLAVTGFGHFAEHAESGGTAYVNTSLSGRGDRYPDPTSRWMASADNYLLLTVPSAGPMRVAVKSVSGETLREFSVGD